MDSAVAQVVSSKVVRDPEEKAKARGGEKIEGERGARYERDGSARAA